MVINNVLSKETSENKKLNDTVENSCQTLNVQCNKNIPLNKKNVLGYLSQEYNSTWNCTNDYCLSDEDYMSLIESYIMTLTEYEWALVVMHVVVFFVGLVGNALVCVAVYRNHSMRTVTNYFIVNLALADFLVILFCLAPTVIWDVTETWFMGEKLCKIILYIQVS